MTTPLALEIVINIIDIYSVYINIYSVSIVPWRDWCVFVLVVTLIAPKGFWRRIVSGPRERLLVRMRYKYTHLEYLGVYPRQLC